MRQVAFAENEFYHIYNRGVDKRPIFTDRRDLDRFFQSICEFNTIEPIGSIFENSFKNKGKKVPDQPLVQFIAYGINPNHFHFILTPLVEHGIEKFMQRLGGYTKYFNERHSRTGVLFQGKFKSKHINSNEYLLHASVYVNLNYKVHKLKENGLFLSSWGEYIGKTYVGICSKDIILGQFKNKGYEKFAENTLISIIGRKDMLSELENENITNLEVRLPS